MELRDYLNVIRARRGVIILATAIVSLVAVAVSLLQPPTYEAQAKVLISEKDTGAALFGAVLPELSSQPERALQTQVQLAEVRPIAEATIKKLGLEETPEQLLRRVDVGSVGQTNIIAITATADSPEAASDVANTIAEEYVAASRERKRETIAEAADEVEQRLESAREEILVLGRRLQASGTSDQMAAELQILTGTYTTLAEKLEQLRINERLEAGSGNVVQAAVANEAPVAPRPARNAILGILSGLVLGLAMAMLYEYLDNTIKSSEEAEKVFGAPVLGIVPLEKYEKGVKRQLVIVDQPGSSSAEAYRVLRNSLDFINFEHELKTIVVTSAAPAEGKSTVCANLAMALSQAGKKVALVSCDFRRPTTEQFFEVNNMIGLSDVLLGTQSLKAALQRPVNDQLLVLTAGKMPPNPSELLGSERMNGVIQSLEEWADWVIIDTPPVLAVADPAAVAKWADGVLLVTKAGESVKDHAAKAADVLGTVGARIIGVIVWGLDESRGAAGYGYYAGGYYYYQSYYGQADRDRETGAASLKKTAGRGIGPVSRTRVATAIFALVTVGALIAMALYVLDLYFGWGLAISLRDMAG